MRVAVQQDKLPNQAICSPAQPLQQSRALSKIHSYCEQTWERSFPVLALAARTQC